MTNWKKELLYAFRQTGDNFDTMETTLSEAELIKEFDNGYGGHQGAPFTAWGDKFVYFPITYDGSEWVGHAPRNPCVIKTEHQGGE